MRFLLFYFIYFVKDPNQANLNLEKRTCQGADAKEAHCAINRAHASSSALLLMAVVWRSLSFTKASACCCFPLCLLVPGL